MTRKAGTCMCMTNQAMLMMAIKRKKMETSVKVSFRTKPRLSEDLPLVKALLVRDCSVLIGLDFERRVCVAYE